jgi:DNA-binding IclR family transcriptional regulator
MDDHTVLGRAVELMDIVVAADGPVSLAELTRRSAVPKATVRRIANTLTKHQLFSLSQDGYASGTRLMSYGMQASQNSQFRSTAMPYLQELHQRAFGAVVFLVDTTDLDHLSLVGDVFDRKYSTDYQSFRKPVDVQDPGVLATAFGRVALAGQPERVRSLLRKGVPRTTRHTPTADEILRSLVRDTARGFALEHEQTLAGWSCIALGLRPVPRPHAVIGVLAPTGRFDTDQFAPAMAQTAAALEKALTRQL